MDHEHGGMDHSMPWEFQTKILAIAYPSYPNHSFFTDDGNGISLPNNISWFGLARTDLSNYTVYLWRTAIFKRDKNGIETKKSCYDDADRDGDYSCIYL